MVLNFRSNCDRKAVSTNGKTSEMVREEIYNAIKTVYSAKNRTDGPRYDALHVTVGDFHITIGKWDNGEIKWYNPAEKVGGGIGYKHYTDNALWIIADLIIHHFIGNASDLETLNAAEAEANAEEIHNTCLFEAGNLAEDTVRLYYKARTISEKIGTHLHNSDPDDDYVPVVNMAMEMREILYQIKRLREDFLDRADDLTGCNCCLEDFMGCNEMIVDGFDLKYSDPDDIFESLWHEAWKCFDGDPCLTNVYNAVLYGFAA